MSETVLFQSAVSHWWKFKKKGQGESKQGGSRDQNLSGKNLDGFIATIRAFLIELGVDRDDIYVGGHFSRTGAILPSTFRPSKNWDIIVVSNSRFCSVKRSASSAPILHAAIEFKSQDKSIGNNQNNRLEESLGNACDFWHTYEANLFTTPLPRPWLGYFFIGKYAEADHGRKEIRQPHFLAHEVYRGGPHQFTDVPRFLGPSYAERYRVFLQQAVGKRLYDAGAFLTTHEGIRRSKPNHEIRFPEFGPKNFLNSLEAHVRANYRK